MQEKFDSIAYDFQARLLHSPEVTIFLKAAQPPSSFWHLRFIGTLMVYVLLKINQGSTKHQ
jgi:hypothetical protein